MAEQRIKFEIKDVANLILSLLPEYYCTEEVNSGDEHTYKIIDYFIRRGEPSMKGTNFVMTISKDKIKIFMFPTLNLEIDIKSEDEFQEIISLYLDFKTKVNDYLCKLLKNKISVKGSHKNPWEKFVLPNLQDIEDEDFELHGIDAEPAPVADLLDDIHIDRDGNVVRRRANRLPE